MPWFIVTLSYQGEKETSKSISRTLRNYLGKGSEVFIPHVRGEGQGFRKEFCLFEGYAFVKCSEKHYPKLMALEEDQPLFEGVVCTVDDDGVRQPEEVDESLILSLQGQVKKELENPEGIDVGECVLVTDGDCRNLQGEVLWVSNTHALVLFDFWSKHRLECIPLFCLSRSEQGVEEDVEFVIPEEDYLPI